ncbi:MAG: ERF family protein [Sphingobacteriales bacterium]
MMQSDNTAELNNALCKAQSALRSATFNKVNPHFKNKYADLAAVIDAIRKPLTDNGLSITQTTQMYDGQLVLLTTLRHCTGQWVCSEYPLPMNATPQQLGSALTYAKRYSLSSMVCLAADDDDDAEATRKGTAAIAAGTRMIASVTEEQADTLTKLVKERQVKIENLLKLTHAESISDIPAATFTKAKDWLEKHPKRVMEDA